VRNYRAAMLEIRNAAIRRVTIDREWIEHIDDILAGEQVAQRYRTDDGATEQYKHDVIPPARIHDELDAICREIEVRADRMHPLQLAALVHHRLTRCWPFEERSGIVARMVANRILIGHGYPPVVFPAHDRQRYYHALHYDITRLHDLMIEDIEIQLALRERVVRHHCAPQRELRAS
jgi:Fic family protein